MRSGYIQDNTANRALFCSKLTTKFTSMKKNIVIATAAILACAAFFSFSFKPALAATKVNTTPLQNTERPLDVVITHVREGKQERMTSIHNTIAGNRLTFIYHDGSRIVFNFVKPIRAGNYEIHDRTSELQAIYYPAGGYPLTLLGFVTMYIIKPLTGRLVQLYDADHEVHISSSGIFAF